MISKSYEDYKKEVLKIYNEYINTFESFGEEVNESIKKPLIKSKIKYLISWF